MKSLVADEWEDVREWKGGWGKKLGKEGQKKKETWKEEKTGEEMAKRNWRRSASKKQKLGALKKGEKTVLE